MSGAGFNRRYTFDPGLAEILKIEGVVIIDRESPGSTTGETTGASVMVGEFEDGPFNVPTEIFDGSDQLATFGGFGFTQDGLPSSNPCARARKADSAVNPEYWNGNGFIALSRKTYPRLFITRVDTSVGSVSFTKLPRVTGNGNFAWDLEPGQTAVFQTAFASTSTATFNAAAASLNSAAGSYPTGFVGGESFNITVDDGTPLQIGPIDVTFTSAQSTQADVVARINAVLGYTAAVAGGGNVTTITGRVRGNTGNVKINSISGSIITTKLGISVTSVIGTGNVGNIDAVTFTEVKAVIQAAVANSVVDRDTDGNLRVALTSGVELLYTPASTADNLGIPEGTADHQPDGFAYMYSTAGTYPITASSDTLTLGVDGEPNFTVAVTNGSTTQASLISQINAAAGFTMASSASATVLKLVGRANGGQVRVVAGTSNILTGSGLTVRVQLARLELDTTIPAGTRIRTSTGTLEVVTMQTVAVTASSLGPYSVKVRPSLDDGTYAGSTANTLVAMVDPAPNAAWSVTNPLALSAALTEGAIDAAYSTALDATRSPSSVAKDANFVWSARQSTAVRSLVRQNAVLASNGLRGRVAVVSPPLGTTTRVIAKSTSAAPGVGATASDRVFYAFPGQSIFISQIAQRGTAGGAGFTADGFVDLHADSCFASVAGLLPPEQNAGQLTGFMDYVSGVERGNPDVQALQEPDYESFRKAGIVATRLSESGPLFQSDVTSWGDISSSKSDGPRRRFADFAEDSLAVIAGPFIKKPMTRKLRGDVYGQFQAFLETLKSPGDEASQRIFDYSLDAKSANPPAALNAGVFRLKTKIGMNPDMLDIVIDATIGRGTSVFNTTT